MTIAAIKTPEEYQAALARLEELRLRLARSPEAAEIDTLADLILAYENRVIESSFGPKIGDGFDAANFLDNEAMIASYLQQFDDSDPMFGDALLTAGCAKGPYESAAELAELTSADCHVCIAAAQLSRHARRCTRGRSSEPADILCVTSPTNDANENGIRSVGAAHLRHDRRRRGDAAFGVL